ncbi:MAG: LacI family DNA-binding transcriptional regulator [Candidatus Weimeria sp.]
MNKITIDDIARALGVSKTTVSRALSGKGRISDSTKSRVIMYAREHDYKPNVMARGLAQSRTYNIAVVTPQENADVNLAFFHRCLVGIVSETEKNGYDVLITVERGNRVDELERIIRNGKVDGVILMRTFFNDKRIDYLRENQIPFVVVGRYQDPDVIQVNNDNFSGSRQMTDTLLKNGVVNPALFGGSKEHIVTNDRLNGFMQAISDNGMNMDDSLVFMDTQDENVLSKAVRKAENAGVDCVFCMDDDIADKTLKVCHEKNISVPYQLKIASFYDAPILSRNVPRISAVAFDENALGMSAAETLIKMINGKDVINITVEKFEIKLRESTD